MYMKSRGEARVQGEEAGLSLAICMNKLNLREELQYSRCALTRIWFPDP